MPKLKQHYIVQKSYQCQYCKVKCRRPQDLRRHLLVHTAASFECDLCGNKFTRFDTLRRHKRDNCRNAQSIRHPTPAKSPQQSPDTVLHPPKFTVSKNSQALPTTAASKVTVSTNMDEAALAPRDFAAKIRNQINGRIQHNKPICGSLGVSMDVKTDYLPHDFAWQTHCTGNIPEQSSIYHTQVPVLPISNSSPVMAHADDQTARFAFYPSRPMYIQTPPPVNNVSYSEQANMSTSSAAFPSTPRSTHPHTPSPHPQELANTHRKFPVQPFFRELSDPSRPNGDDLKFSEDRPIYQSQQVPQLQSAFGQYCSSNSMPSIGSLLQLNLPSQNGDANFYSQNCHYAVSVPVQSYDVSGIPERKPQLMPIEPKTGHITQRLSPRRFDEYMH